MKVHLSNDTRLDVKYLARKDASSTFCYETKDGNYGEVNGVNIKSIFP